MRPWSFFDLIDLPFFAFRVRFTRRGRQAARVMAAIEDLRGRR